MRALSIPPPPFLPGRSWRVHLTLLDFAVLLTGLVFSPPLLSIGVIGICVVGILDIPRGINPHWLSGIRKGLRDPFAWAVAAAYLLLLLDVWQTEDWTYYGERLRVKSVLLAVPVGWWGLPRLRTAERRGVLLFFVALILATAVGVTLNYLLDFTAINQAIKEGRAIPVPRNHIRFSLLVALATVAALELARVRAFGRLTVWLVVGALLFAFQHLLAVRSGLVCAYLGIGAMLLVFVLQSGRWRVGVLSLAFLLALPVAGYLTLPSLRGKIDYARYELWRQRNQLDSRAYSDAGRMTSIRLGWELFTEHPLTGVGQGNLRREMDQRYAERLPGVEAKRPHNQFVSLLAGGGLLLFLPLIGAWLYLLVGRGRWRDPAFVAVWCILMASCLVENTLENSAGVCLFTFFLYFFRPAPLPNERT